MSVYKKYLDKKIMIAVAAVFLLGVLLAVSDYFSDVAGFNGILKRPGAGQAAVHEQLTLKQGDGSRENVTVDISPRSLTKKQRAEMIALAKKEIDSSLAGKNKDLENVSLDLEPRSSYADGNVDCEWDFSERDIISPEGRLRYEALEKRSYALCYAEAKLSCGGDEEIYSVPVMLKMPTADTPAGFSYYLARSLKEADEKGQTKAFVELPESIKGIRVKWQKPYDRRGPYLALLAPLIGVAIVVARRRDEEQKRKIYFSSLEADYPSIVSALSLYVSAGITIRSSLQRMFASYCSSKQLGGERAGYEAVGMVVRELEDGVGEQKAYESLGELTGHEKYGKLSMILTKNHKKGASDLSSVLEKEEREAFEERKLKAKTLGEEASTKLLLPMMLLLGVVIVILIAPALRKF